MYINKKDLHKAIAAYRTTGVISDTLGVMIVKVVNGACSRYYHGWDRDEQEAECVLLVLNKLHLINEDGDAFSYITQMVKNKIHYDYAHQQIYKQRLGRYAEFNRTLPEV